MWAGSFILTLINIIIGFIELFISLRIILKLFGANPAAPFVAWVYDMSNAVIWPFINMFPSPTLEGGFVVEFSALIALLVYAFIGYILSEFVAYVGYRSGHYRRKIIEERD